MMTHLLVQRPEIEARLSITLDTTPYLEPRSRCIGGSLKRGKEEGQHGRNRDSIPKGGYRIHPEWSAHDADEGRAATLSEPWNAVLTPQLLTLMLLVE